MSPVTICLNTYRYLRTIEHTGITFNKMAYLSCCAEKPRTGLDVAAMMGVSHSGAIVRLDDLVADGFLKRENRRNGKYSPTRHGETVLVDFYKAMRGTTIYDPPTKRRDLFRAKGKRAAAREMRALQLAGEPEAPRPPSCEQETR